MRWGWELDRVRRIGMLVIGESGGLSCGGCLGNGLGRGGSLGGWILLGYQCLSLGVGGVGRWRGIMEIGLQ